MYSSERFSVQILYSLKINLEFPYQPHASLTPLSLHSCTPSVNWSTSPTSRSTSTRKITCNLEMLTTKWNEVHRFSNLPGETTYCLVACSPYFATFLSTLPLETTKSIASNSSMIFISYVDYSWPGNAKSLRQNRLGFHRSKWLVNSGKHKIV